MLPLPDGSFLTQVSFRSGAGRGVGGPDSGAWMGDFASGALGFAGGGAAVGDGPEGRVPPPSIGDAASDIEQLVAMVRYTCISPNSYPWRR